MSERKLLTIGICSYNNEPFINQLIYQIEHQYEEVKEFVDFYIYDDCSKYVPKVPIFCNLVVSDENNGSPSYGRNYTIDNCNSKYVLFMDGDDTFTCDIIEIVNYLKDKDLDLITSNVVKIDQDGRHWPSPFLYSKVLDCDIKKVVHQTGIWSIYSVEFLKQHRIRYEENMRYEDNYFSYNVLLGEPRIGCIDTPYYGWRTVYNSFTYSHQNLVHRVELYKKTLDLLWDHKDKGVAPYILFSLWNQLYSNVVRDYLAKNTEERKWFVRELNIITKANKALIQQLKKDYDKEFADVIFNNNITNYFVLNIARKILNVKKSRNLVIKNTFKVFCILPIKKGKVFLNSQYGQYSDNPKYYFEALVNKNNHYFAVKDKELAKKDHFFDYNDRIKHYYHYYTSETILFNTWMDPTLKKRKGQKWVQMWHGYPYKKIYTDIKIFDHVNSPEKIELKQKAIANWDEVYSLDKHNTEIFRNLFPNVNVVETIYPRIQWLIENKDNEKLKQEIREKYSLDDEKITLYAPTYRPYKVYLDVNEIKELANYKILFQPHPMMQYGLLNGFLDEYVFEDIQEILLVVDEVITDYSSIMKDFEYINNNIKKYAPDKELYSEIHGLY